MFDFSNVKSITIPEGNVKSISFNGATLWKKQEQEEYIFTEYLQFNKDKRFDTGIVCNQNTKIEISFSRDDATAAYMYGVRNSGNTASITAYLSSSGSWRFGNKYKNYTLALNETHNATIQKSGITMNGTKTTFTSSNFTANATLVIGTTRGTDGSLSSPQFIGKIYSFKMYNGTELILDWLPCKTADGKVGFYDNVSKAFVEPV